MIQLKSYSAADTRKLAGHFAELLKAGDSVGLTGSLGSGKTVFISGVCAGLGYGGAVTSSTFTIMHPYPTMPPIYHFDCFRLKQPQEIATAGFDEFLASGEGVVIVEWADIIRDYFADWSYEVEFNFDFADENQRVIQFSTRQPGRSRMLHAFLKNALAQM